MKRPEDQAWDQVVERIELGVTDAQLADAERALRGVESEEVRPEFVETVMARATAEVVAAVEAAPVAKPAPLRLLPRMRRFAAAAAVFLFGSKLSAATTVTVLAAVTTTVVVVIQNSHEMTYPEVLQLLRGRGNSREQLSSGLGQVADRIRDALRVLRRIRDDSRTPPVIAQATREGLARLASGQRSLGTPIVDDIKDAKRGADDVLRSDPDRLSYIESTLALAATGLELIERLETSDPHVAEKREFYVGKLRTLLER